MQHVNFTISNHFAIGDRRVSVLGSLPAATAVIARKDMVSIVTYNANVHEISFLTERFWDFTSQSLEFWSAKTLLRRSNLNRLPGSVPDNKLPERDIATDSVFREAQAKVGCSSEVFSFDSTRKGVAPQGQTIEHL